MFGCIVAGSLCSIRSIVLCCLTYVTACYNSCGLSSVNYMENKGIIIKNLLD